MPRTRLPLLVTLAALLLAAPAAAAADCPGADLQPASADPVEVRAAVVCLTNAERAAAGVGTLVAEGRLESAAQGYAQRMVAERFFAHVGPDGSTLADRLAAYTGWLGIGENIGWGEGSLATPRSIVAAWMRSPGHRANILSGLFTEIGVGVVTGAPEGSSSRPAATYAAEYGTRLFLRADSDPLEGGVSAAAVPRAVQSGSPPAAAVPRAVQSGSRPAAARRPLLRCRRGTVRRSVRGSVRCVRKAARR